MITQRASDGRRVRKLEYATSEGERRRHAPIVDFNHPTRVATNEAAVVQHEYELVCCASERASERVISGERRRTIK